MKMQLIRGVAVAACTALLLAGITGIDEHENEREHVILLHGLAMSSLIMTPLKLYLEEQGYVVHNINYPSTSKTIESIASEYIRPVVDSIRHQGDGNIHIVTHSMGGVAARYYLHMYPASPVTSMVMIAPPNRGSTMAEVLKKYKIARWFFGPALTQLSTGSGSILHRLDPLKVPTGVIAGCASMNPVNSLILPGDDDGTVAVSHTPVEGMHDFVVIPRSHSGILFDKKVYKLVVRFLREGSF
ncbi:MAG: esterase/lipase family protein [Spirochaetota bacterium]